jgi:hypothetical protein
VRNLLIDPSAPSLHTPAAQDFQLICVKYRDRKRISLVFIRAGKDYKS